MVKKWIDTKQLNHCKKWTFHCYVSFYENREPFLQYPPVTACTYRDRLRYTSAISHHDYIKHMTEIPRLLLVTTSPPAAPHVVTSDVWPGNTGDHPHVRRTSTAPGRAPVMLNSIALVTAPPSQTHLSLQAWALRDSVSEDVRSTPSSLSGLIKYMSRRRIHSI